jgi:hypothetical protein
VGHGGTGVGNMRDAYRVSVGIPEGKTLLVRHRHTCECDTKIEREGVG